MQGATAALDPYGLLIFIIIKRKLKSQINRKRHKCAAMMQLLKAIVDEVPTPAHPRTVHVMSTFSMNRVLYFTLNCACGMIMLYIRICNSHYKLRSPL